MITVARAAYPTLEHAALRAMFEARKRVFVDLLKWDVPVVQERFEIDQFDDEHAVYLIVSDADGEHLGSARLLKTTRPHILDSLFPELCAAAPPKAPDVLEITRFCLGRNRSAAERQSTRNHLVAALVDYALANGIHAYSAVAELSWLQQILAFGWKCRPLGLPRRIGGSTLGALLIGISAETPELLTASGIYSRQALEPLALPQAA